MAVRGVVRGGSFTGQNCDEEKVAALALGRGTGRLGEGQGRRGALAAAVTSISIPLQEKGLTDLFVNSPGVNLSSHGCALLGQGVIMRF